MWGSGGIHENGRLRSTRAIVPMQKESVIRRSMAVFFRPLRCIARGTSVPRATIILLFLTAEKPEPWASTPQSISAFPLKL